MKNKRVNNRHPDFEQALSIGQGLYFFLTGVWPILHSASFEKVTGPKADLWLVKTIGGLISIVGLVLTYAGLSKRHLSPEIQMLAAGSAACLSASDTIYALKKRISPIYLLDAAVESLIILGWGLFSVKRRGNPSSPLAKTGRR